MQIAFLLQTYPVPSEVFIQDRINSLINAGHTVDVYVGMFCNKAQVHHPKKNSHALLQSIQGVVQSNKFLYARLETIRDVFLPKFLPIKQIKCDILHAPFGTNGLRAIELKKRNLITGKVSVSFHGYDLTSYVVRHSATVYQELFQVADMLLPVSHHFANKLRAMGCPKSKIHTIPIGISVKKFTSIPSSTKKNYFLFVGRLVEKKGCTILLESFSEYITKNPAEITVVIAGDGPLKQQLIQRCITLGLQKNVQFVGWQTPTQLNNWYNHSCALVVPSLTAVDGDEETIPGTIKEALLTKTPVIATNHGGIPELIQPYKTGILIAENSVSALTLALKAVIDDPVTNKQYAENGYTIIKKHYTDTVVAQQIITVFKQAIS